MKAQTRGRILIVEDDDQFVKDLLAMWNPPRPVFVAASGREAFDYLQNTVPDLVLLDLCLPHYLAETDETEGFEILSYIRGRSGRSVPVVVISRATTADERALASENGADAFLEKPFAISKLEQVVDKLLLPTGGE